LRVSLLNRGENPGFKALKIPIIYAPLNPSVLVKWDSYKSLHLRATTLHDMPLSHKNAKTEQRNVGQNQLLSGQLAGKSIVRLS